MKYLDLFTGIGGFTLGIQQAYENIQKLRSEDERQPPRASTGDTKRQCEQLSELSMEGLSCIGFSEIDKYAAKVYQHHFPTHKNYGDIKLINAEELPDFDLLVGGFPCQSFSIAGKRKGFDDTRGTLFFDIARILRAKQPRLFLLENVKGLLSHDNGETFRTIISTLDELGYDLQWQVLNSKNHGVPQNRERIFIVGHLRGTCRPEVFPFTCTDEQDDRRINIVAHRDIYRRNRQTFGADGLVEALDTAQGGGRGHHVKIDVSEMEEILKSEGLEITEKGYESLDNINKKIIQKSPDWRENGSLREFEEYSPALRASMGDNHPMVTGSDMKIRRLTPTECERLQGFPDGWTAVENTSDSQRYKMCGNAVTVNVIRDIMAQLL